MVPKSALITGLKRSLIKKPIHTYKAFLIIVLTESFIIFKNKNAQRNQK